jgi:hypothetical protein
MGALAYLALVIPGFDPKEDALGVKSCDLCDRANGTADRSRCQRRTVISMPTLTKPAGKTEAMTDPAAIPICKTMMGVAQTCGIPTMKWPKVISRVAAIFFSADIPVIADQAHSSI